MPTVVRAQVADEARRARLAVMGALPAYVERAPLPSLARGVRTVWVQQTGPGRYVQRNLPTGGAELQCRVGSVPRLIGPLTAAKIEVLPAESTVVGVRFRAGAAAALLGVPADELVDLVVPLDELWGDRAVRLGELLASAASSSAEAASADDGLGGGRLADLAGVIGYADQSHLSRECVRLAGLTPRQLLGGRADRCGSGHDHSASYQPFLAGRRGSTLRR